MDTSGPYGNNSGLWDLMDSNGHYFNLLDITGMDLAGSIGYDLALRKSTGPIGP